MRFTVGCNSFNHVSLLAQKVVKVCQLRRYKLRKLSFQQAREGWHTACRQGDSDASLANGGRHGKVAELRLCDVVHKAGRSGAYFAVDCEAACGGNDHKGAFEILRLIAVGDERAACGKVLHLCAELRGNDSDACACVQQCLELARSDSAAAYNDAVLACNLQHSRVLKIIVNKH